MRGPEEQNFIPEQFYNPIDGLEEDYFGRKAEQDKSSEADKKPGGGPPELDPLQQGSEEYEDAASCFI